MNINKQKGGLKWIIIIIIGFIAVSYFFNINIKDAVEDEQTQENYQYVKEQTVAVYENHLSTKVEYFWNEIFIKFIWTNIKENFNQIKDNNSLIIENQERESE